MKRYTAPIQNANGWNAHSHHMKELIGIPAKKKLPVEGKAPVVVQGHQVYVLSMADAKARKVKHRVRAICGKCGVDVSAGRLMQHKCR